MRSVAIICILLLSAPVMADERLITTYGLGFGLGYNDSRGDYTQRFSGPMFGGGFDYHSEHFFLVFRNASSLDNKNKYSDMVFGIGSSAVKIGIGFMGLAIEIPTDPQQVKVSMPFLDAMVLTDSDRNTSLSVGNSSLYLRITPLHTNKTIFSIDGYYGLHASGSMEIPVTVMGYDAHLLTEPYPAGGTWGGGISIIKQLTNMPDWMWRIEYTYRKAKMDGGRTAINGDFIGGYGEISMPDLDFSSRAILASLVVGLK